MPRMIGGYEFCYSDDEESITSESGDYEDILIGVNDFKKLQGEHAAPDMTSTDHGNNSAANGSEIVTDEETSRKDSAMDLDASAECGGARSPAKELDDDDGSLFGDGEPLFGDSDNDSLFDYESTMEPESASEVVPAIEPEKAATPAHKSGLALPKKPAPHVGLALPKPAPVKPFHRGGLALPSKPIAKATEAPASTPAAPARVTEQRPAQAKCLHTGGLALPSKKTTVTPASATAVSAQVTEQGTSSGESASPAGPSTPVSATGPSTNVTPASSCPSTPTPAPKQGRKRKASTQRPDPRLASNDAARANGARLDAERAEKRRKRAEDEKAEKEAKRLADPHVQRDMLFHQQWVTEKAAREPTPPAVQGGDQRWMTPRREDRDLPIWVNPDGSRRQMPVSDALAAQQCQYSDVWSAHAAEKQARRAEVQRQRRANHQAFSNFGPDLEFLAGIQAREQEVRVSRESAVAEAIIVIDDELEEVPCIDLTGSGPAPRTPRRVSPPGLKRTQASSANLGARWGVKPEMAKQLAKEVAEKAEKAEKAKKSAEKKSRKSSGVSKEPAVVLED
ncbi:unnamed protein product [Zymoseptoria tritici ST99CH_1A5]|uniref:Uncharacterized protein n=1 Tax=Zymoseptoria tritici ST99CH_1A5 TaxID=1276529 RepID=A0A1Y6LUZ4_ZYMTR|nr:unnamed protein product [Zymoseptoria tritici ST99CH_1A5]